MFSKCKDTLITQEIIIIQTGIIMLMVKVEIIIHLIIIELKVKVELIEARRS
jgi:hypothetical protein